MLQGPGSVSKPFELVTMEGPSPHSEADKEEMRQVLKEHLEAGAGRGTLGNWRDWEHTALSTPKKVQFSRITHWRTCAGLCSLLSLSPTFAFCCPTHSLVQPLSTHYLVACGLLSSFSLFHRSFISLQSTPHHILACLVSGARKRIRWDCNRSK
jgi:hypothetical protein